MHPMFEVEVEIVDPLGASTFKTYATDDVGDGLFHWSDQDGWVQDQGTCQVSFSSLRSFKKHIEDDAAFYGNTAKFVTRARAT